ncbi:MAG: hypothetical protein MHM6MM_002752 [Cercozoa sp. M6MM]
MSVYSPHALRVMRIYRRSLKVILSYAGGQLQTGTQGYEGWRFAQEAKNARELIEQSRGLSEPDLIKALADNLEHMIEKFQHQVPYRPPYVHTGTDFSRHPDPTTRFGRNQKYLPQLANPDLTTAARIEKIKEHASQISDLVEQMAEERNFAVQSQYDDDFLQQLQKAAGEKIKTQ